MDSILIYLPREKILLGILFECLLSGFKRDNAQIKTQNPSNFYIKVHHKLQLDLAIKVSI